MPSTLWEEKIRPPLKSRKAQFADTAAVGAGASPICFSRAAASQTVARGRIPGSVKLVCSRQLMTKKNRMAAMMGMARVRWRAKKGQLEKERERDVSRYPGGCLGHRVAAPGRRCHPSKHHHSPGRMQRYSPWVSAATRLYVLLPCPSVPRADITN